MHSRSVPVFAERCECRRKRSKKDHMLSPPFNLGLILPYNGLYGVCRCGFAVIIVFEYFLLTTGPETRIQTFCVEFLMHLSMLSPRGGGGGGGRGSGYPRDFDCNVCPQGGEF